MSFNKLGFLAKLDFTEVKEASGVFPKRTETLTYQAGGNYGADDRTTYNFVHAGRASLTASGGGGATATIDLWASKTSYTGNTKANPTKLIGLLLIFTGAPATAAVEVTEGASNPADLGLSGTGAKLTFVPDANGDAFFAIQYGADKTISNTAKTIDLTSTGSTAITVDYYFIVGGGTDS